MIILLVVMHVDFSDAFKYYRLNAEEYMTKEETQDVQVTVKVHHAPGMLVFFFLVRIDPGMLNLGH